MRTPKPWPFKLEFVDVNDNAVPRKIVIHATLQAQTSAEQPRRVYCHMSIEEAKALQMELTRRIKLAEDA